MTIKRTRLQEKLKKRRLRSRQRARRAFPYAKAAIDHPTPVRAPRTRKTPLRPFCGVDGEGAGKNRQGQQHYLYLRAGDHQLWTGKPLTTKQCLEFLLSLPKGPIYVGFGFGYDATQILRGVADDPDHRRAMDRLTRLFRNKSEDESHYTLWGDYGLEYLPGQYFRVCRMATVIVKDEATGVERIVWRSIKGSSRTIWETLGFFQQSFLSSLKDWHVGVADWDMIATLKKERSEFQAITKRERDYCGRECVHLADMMERFRATCHAAGLSPKTWNGPGKIAAYLHDLHGTITKGEVETDTLADGKTLRHPEYVLDYASRAFYGGRFEVTRIGEISTSVWAYDINSAFPDAMTRLPCLRHGHWVQQNSAQLAKAKGHFVARVKFTHPNPDQMICGLPVRQKDGRIYFPREGQGIYWGVEIHAAIRAGAVVEYLDGFRYHQSCKCKVFDWIPDLYAERVKLGKDVRGIPIKLAINALYGLLVQRVGKRRFANPIHGGLITAMTRAKLLDAVAGHHDQIVMFATDAVFSTERLGQWEPGGPNDLTPKAPAITLGPELGQWSEVKHDRLFVVQPGLYWGTSKRPKTRGIPSESFFADHVPTFEKAWFNWCDLYAEATKFAHEAGEYLPSYTGGSLPPTISVPMKIFIGLKLAHARKQLELAGRWMQLGEDGEPMLIPVKGKGKKFSFVWKGKRSMDGFQFDGRQVITRPAEGDQNVMSVTHKGSPELNTEFDLSRYYLDEQPDFVDLSPPHGSC